MADVSKAGHPGDGVRPLIGDVLTGSFRIFSAAPLFFLAYGLASQIATLARLILSPPVGSKSTPHLLVAFLGGKLLLVFFQTTITHAAVRIGAREPMSVGEVLALGARRYLPMLVMTALGLLAVYAGIILLIVPGLIVAVVWSVTVPVCALEGAGPITSFKRSAFLTKGQRWRIFGVYCILLAPLILLVAVLTITLTLRGHQLAAQWFDVVRQMVWIPFDTIVSAEIYVQLRGLKENVGIARVFE